MNTRDFCFWLRGYFELCGESEIDADKAKVISDHLKLVMNEQEKPFGWTNQQWEKELEMRRKEEELSPNCKVNFDGLVDERTTMKYGGPTTVSC